MTQQITRLDRLRAAVERMKTDPKYADEVSRTIQRGLDKDRGERRLTPGELAKRVRARRPTHA